MSKAYLIGIFVALLVYAGLTILNHKKSKKPKSSKKEDEQTNK